MAHGDPARRTSPALPPSEAARVHRAYEDGAAHYGEFALTRAEFRASVAARAARRAAADGAAPDATAEYLNAAALADVYLAAACDAGDERAWEALLKALRTRLEGCAVRRGASAAEAQAVVQDLLGDLARPPPSGGSRTLLGTFDGTGSLFGWTAIVLSRRLAARSRERRFESLETVAPALRVGSGTPTGSPPERTPPGAVADAETERRFRAALAAAWEGLTGQERLALVWKHRDGLTQRRIADLLGVVESRVSRIVSEAVDRLAAGVRAVLSRDDAPAGSDLWARLAAAVSGHLSSVEVGPAPPSGGTLRAPTSPVRVPPESPAR
jgi:RNA polymerase sigma factor (sigma-70 family)